MGQWHICKKSLLVRRLPPDKIDRPLSNFAVNQAPLLDVVGCNILGWLTGKTFHHIRNIHDRRIETGRAREHRLIRGSRYAIPLIKTSLMRETPLAIPQMPFPKHPGRVSGFFEDLRQRFLPRVNPLRQTSRNRLERAGSDGMSACHQCRPRWHTIALDIEVQKLHALCCKLIDSRRRRSTHGAAAITTQLPPTQVISQNQDDIGMLLIWHAYSSEIFRSLMRRAQRSRSWIIRL